MTMEEIESREESKWLANNPEGYLSTGIEPKGFPYYARIFHAMWEDPDASGIVTYDERDRQRLESGERERNKLGNVDLDSLGGVATGVPIGMLGGPRGWRRLRWKELAERRGISFSGDERNAPRVFADKKLYSWPTSIQPPPEGSLDTVSMVRLATELDEWSDHPKVFAYFCLMAFRKWTNDRMFHGSLVDLARLLATGDPKTTPQNWWAEDHSWVVFTDYDLTTTTICGPDALIDRLVNDDVLECYRVEPAG